MFENHHNSQRKVTECHKELEVSLQQILDNNNKDFHMFSTEDHRHSSEVKIKRHNMINVKKDPKAATIAKQNSLVDMCDLSIISEKDVEATALKNKILAGKQLNER